MSLNETPEIVNWPPIHYVFVEKSGPFPDTAMAAWQALKKLVPEIQKRSKIESYLSLYKTEPEMIYRAGVAVAEKPGDLPAGLKYERFHGGKYHCFTLRGSYMQLPEACGRVSELVEEKKMGLREDWYIEHYVNDPDTTPEEKLETGILVPAR